MKIKLLSPRGLLVALLLIFSLQPLISRAQENNSVVKGTVRGEHNQPIAGASVIVKGAENGTTTKSKGSSPLRCRAMLRW